MQQEQSAFTTLMGLFQVQISRFLITIRVISPILLHPLLSLFSSCTASRVLVERMFRMLVVFFFCEDICPMNWFAMVYLILVCLTVDSRYRSFGYTIFFSLFGLFIISSWQIYDHCGYVNKLYCFWAKHCSFLNCSDQETFSLMFLIQIISLTSCVHLLTSVWSGLFNKSAMWTAESLRVFKGENATLTELKQNLCCYLHFSDSGCLQLLSCCYLQV